MQIVQIDDYYIEDLRKTFSHVMKAKKHKRTHTRKYLGVVLQINKLNYYVPFSSPKNHDYTKDNKIKSDTLFDAKMIELDNSGRTKLLGTLKFNNMVPVPLMYVEPYSIDNEKDLNYKNVILAELKWINKNQTYIKNKAVKIYKFKSKQKRYLNNKNVKYYENILPYYEIEKYVIKKYRL